MSHKTSESIGLELLDGWEGATRFPARNLIAFAAEIFQAVGVSEERARRSAEVLVVADSRGIDSHGLARLPFYSRRLRQGLVDADAQLTVLRETSSTLALDANNGPGLVLAPEAMERCITKAEESGICLATVRRSNHFGAAGYYALMAARRGLCGVGMTNASPLVVPTFGAEATVGTNPFAIGVPTGDGPPLVLDMSCSTVAWGKVEIARRAGKPIPAGWAVDDGGLPTTDPFAARWLTPLGGDRATCGHKGYGLAVMVDVLCGPLASGAWSVHVSGSRGGAHASGTGHSFMAWRIDAFREPEEFFADVREMIADLRATRPAAGHEATGVLLPGDPETTAETANERLGVPVKQPVLDELKTLATEIGVAFNLG